MGGDIWNKANKIGWICYLVKRIVQFCLSCPVSIKKVYMPDLYKVKQTVQAARGGWYDPHKARQTG